MAVVKIVGYDYTDYQSVSRLINYCIDKKKSQGNYCFYNLYPQIAPIEILNVARFFGDDDFEWNTKVLHIIISFSHSDMVSTSMACSIGHEIAGYFMQRYQVLFAVHNNTDNIHLHMIVAMYSFIDGKPVSMSENYKTQFRRFVDTIIDNYSG